MQLSMPVRLTILGCATAIILAVIVALVLTGAEIDAGAILSGSGVLIGGLLYGVGAAGGPSRGAGAALLILGLCGSLGACGAVHQGSGGLQACEAEAAVVDALGGAYESVAELEGVPAEVKAELVEALRVGRTLIDSCIAARDRAGWVAWVGIALRIADSIAGFIQRARAKLELLEAPEAPEVPPDLLEAIRLLEVEVARG